MMRGFGGFRRFRHRQDPRGRRRSNQPQDTGKVLLIKAVCASDLIDNQTIGKMSPCVVFHLGGKEGRHQADPVWGGQKFRTSIAKAGGRNPVWNDQPFALEFPHLSGAPIALFLTIFNQSTLGSGIIGISRIDFTQLASSLGPELQTFDIPVVTHGPNPRAAGTIQISLAVVPKQYIYNENDHNLDTVDGVLPQPPPPSGRAGPISRARGWIADVSHAGSQPDYMNTPDDCQRDRYGRLVSGSRDNQNRSFQQPSAAPVTVGVPSAPPAKGI